MRVDAEKQRAVDAVLLPVAADRLRDRQDVPFVEAACERGAAVPGGAEADALRRAPTDPAAGVVRRDQPRHVDERRRIGRVAGQRADGRRRGQFVVSHRAHRRQHQDHVQTAAVSERERASRDQRRVRRDRCALGGLADSALIVDFFATGVSAVHDDPVVDACYSCCAGGAPGVAPIGWPPTPSSPWIGRRGRTIPLAASSASFRSSCRSPPSPCRRALFPSWHS